MSAVVLPATWAGHHRGQGFDALDSLRTIRNSFRTLPTYGMPRRLTHTFQRCSDFAEATSSQPSDQAIVDDLEVIQIEKQHRRHRSAIARHYANG